MDEGQRPLAAEKREEGLRRGKTAFCRGATHRKEKNAL